MLIICLFVSLSHEFLSGGSDSKESARSARDPGLIPGLERSPGEWSDNRLQYSCLGNPMDTGAWLQSMGSQKVVHDWVTVSLIPWIAGSFWIYISNFSFTQPMFFEELLSSTLWAWDIPNWKICCGVDFCFWNWIFHYLLKNISFWKH